MPLVTIGQGQSCYSVARDRGFFWQTIWDHPDNAALKAQRGNPGVLFPGDQLFVPDKEKRWEERPVEAKHTFKRLGDPIVFRLQLTVLGEPRSNEPYTLEVDGLLLDGTTDGEGRLEQTLPGNARSGWLRLQGGQEEYPVRFGHLDPVDTLSGVQQRLNNLGFRAGPEHGRPHPELTAALLAFQGAHGLAASGQPDEATKGKLKELQP